MRRSIAGHEFVGEIVERETRSGTSTSATRSWCHSLLPAWNATIASVAKHRDAPKASCMGTVGLQTPLMVARLNTCTAHWQTRPLSRPPSGIPEEMMVLMADIFLTGYFAASRFLKNLNQRDRDEYTAVVVGCGPVGI